MNHPFLFRHNRLQGIPVTLLSPKDLQFYVYLLQKKIDTCKTIIEQFKERIPGLPEYEESNLDFTPKEESFSFGKEEMKDFTRYMDTLRNTPRYIKIVNKYPKPPSKEKLYDTLQDYSIKLDSLKEKAEKLIGSRLLNTSLMGVLY